ncbi:calcium-binding and coiled-coil domain-containing protein 1-like [Haliotis cracherodii]|uniref:calcium-binding and coiled-coil domain-containing protein 1-like n=1 Tax=Haliotis cracherodii TaxID=6455 RepID=UPI0039E882F7
MSDPSRSKGCPRCNASSKVWGRKRLVLEKPNAEKVLIKQLEASVADGEKELKLKQDELDNIRGKYNTEREERKKLQQDYDRLLSSQGDASQKLVLANESLDKLRLETKKKNDQAEKQQRAVSVMEDRMRNLEIRASEVEKAELTLESTRKNLEASVAECRSKDTEIRKMVTQCEERDMKLHAANEKISTLERKMNDLKLQVRHELMKNENIEKGLETIPRLKDDILDRDKRIKQLVKEVEEKTALMTAARKAVRDYKDKLRDADKKLEASRDMDLELKLAQCEVSTLKKLMSGKDTLVLQKCQALDLAKEVIDSLNTSSVDPEKLGRIQKVLERLCSTADPSREGGTPREGDTSLQAESSISSNMATSDCSGGSKSRMGLLRPSSSPHMSDSNKENMINVNVPPYSMDNGHADHSERTSPFLDRPKHHRGNMPTRPKTAHIRRSASFHNPGFHPPSSRSTSFRSSANTSAEGRCNGHLYKSETRTGYKFQPSLDYSIGVLESKRKQTRPYSAMLSSPTEDSDSDTGWGVPDNTELLQRLSHEQRVALSNMTAADKDKLLMEVISIGDRVSISVSQKAPRYGRKKVKPIVYTGMVKYRGNLDKEFYDARMYAGLKLDEPIGDSDGTYKGKRYMFTPAEHGKFIKMRDISLILNVQTGHYMPLGRMLLLHLVKKAQEGGDTESSHSLNSS